MSESIRNKVAVITGGATGIGRATAEALGAAGVRVVIAGRDEAQGEGAVAVIRQAGGEARFVRCDVRREADIASLFGAAVAAFGGVDLVFNNAGIEGGLGALTDEREEMVQAVLDTNVKGVFLVMKHAIPALVERGGGVILNTASFVGTVAPHPGGVIYGASKAAVLSMTAAAALGAAEHGVRIHALCPWVTDTPMMDRLTGGQAVFKAQFGAMNPSGGIASPADVAGAAVRLLSGEAEVPNGGAVLVDRGGALTALSTTYAPAA